MPSASGLIQFKYGLQTNYDKLETKDANTVYFATDSQRMFVGDTEYTRPVLTGTSAPTIDSPLNTLFYNTSSKTLYTNTADGWLTIATNFSYTHPESGVAKGTYGQVTVDTQGHVTGGEVVTDVAHGGTGKSTATVNSLLVGNGTSALKEVAPGTAGQVLKYTASGPAWGADNNDNTTYTIAAGTANGSIKVTPSSGSAYSVSVTGLKSAAYTDSTDYATAAQGTKADKAMPTAGGTFTGNVTLNADPTTDLGAATKKYVDTKVSSAVTSLFKFKGTVATKEKLPATGNTEGDVYHVTADQGEYIWAKVDGATTASWEPLGSIVDLQDYAKSAEVIQRVTGATGMVPKLTAEGTLVSTGFTLGKSVPADAKFTDTVYSHPAGSAPNKTLGLYKVATDATSHVKELVPVKKSDITALDIPGQDTTYDDFTGATDSVAGVHGLVPAPAEGDQAKFLRADGTWVVPDNNTYAGDRGISLVGGKFGHSNTAITAKTTATDTTKTLTWGGTLKVDTVKYDTYGHITGSNVVTFTMPANPNTTYTLSSVDNAVVLTPSSGSATKVALSSDNLTVTTPTANSLKVNMEWGTF